MADSDRRDFIKTTGVAAVGTAALSASSYAAVQGANERIVVGVVGPGGMGTSHIRTLVTQKDVRIAQVCDVDRQRLATAAKNATQDNRAPATTNDMRRVFENRDITAVFIATPDHWHAPATLLACAAGKHVYVEKPCSHNVREGRLMIEAARRHRRIVQVGTQSRSTEHVRAAMDRLQNGAIGDILVAKVWNSQRRSTIGHAEPTAPPPRLNFDMWLGPAPESPYRSNLLHSSWRWFREFGTGDMGNDGVHDLDIGRWGLGVDTHPTRVTALGGKYFFDDDQEFPDTQTVIFEYDPGEGESARGTRQLIFEQRIWSPYVQEGHENGNAFYGTEGMMVLGKGRGWQLFGPRNELRESMDGRPDLRAHHRNFFDSIRNGQAPHAGIEVNHLSTSLCHLGNLATRLRRTLVLDGEREKVLSDEAANEELSRQYREGHWAAPKV
jgi:predicted dehydrogenase